MRRMIVAMVLCGVVLGACARASSPRATVQAIEVFGPYRANEADDFAESLRRFERETGIQVNYTGSANFVKDLEQRVLTGVSAPDIAIVPQPGVVDAFIEADQLVALSPDTSDAVEQNFANYIDLVGADYATFAAPYRSTLKSLVWYRPDVFAARGWSVPTSMDELNQLVEQIATTEGADGSTSIPPWCFTMFAGTATGWAATDWLEDLVLRQAGPTVYDEWVSGARKFDDPAVRTALESFVDLVLRNGRSAGGIEAIVQNPVEAAGEPLFGSEPGCAMYKQANFARSWFPDGAEVGKDVDFFVLPSTEPGQVAPLVTGGDSLVQFTDDPRVDQLMQYLVSPDGSRVWAERGGYFSDRTSVDPDKYYDDVDAQFAALLQEDRVQRFDGSDRMPPQIGADLLWSEITKWVSGAITLDEFVTAMDTAREELATSD